MSTTTTSEEVFAQIKRFIAEIIGEDVVEEIEIERESVFTRDLEMDSIELVALAEKVNKKYGDKADFVAWFSGMELADLVKISLGEIVDFIADAYAEDK